MPVALGHGPAVQLVGAFVQGLDQQALVAMAITTVAQRDQYCRTIDTRIGYCA